MADLYQINSLYSACGQLIQSNLKTVKKEAKWLELKKRAPELAFAILEDVEEFGNGKVNINKYTIGNTSSNICRLKVLYLRRKSGTKIMIDLHTFHYMLCFL
jgi:hypothetical protein